MEHQLSHVLMHKPHRLVIALSIAGLGCNGNGASGSRDTAVVQQSADSPATAAQSPAPRPATDSAAALAKGKEEGTVPATPTPTVTSESSIAALRQQLQRLDGASVPDLQGSIREHSKMVEDLFTTMRVEVDAVTAPTKASWLASADSVEKNLALLSSAQGEALRTAFRAHSTRVRRLLDEFRVLVPRSSE
jgi:hypothetical protein